MRSAIKAIGVSKRCCPLCACILRQFFKEFNLKIEVVGSHGQVSVCALPPWLPEHVVENVVSKFASDLAKILSRLGDISRKRTDSATSVDSTPFSEDEDDDIIDKSTWRRRARRRS